MLRHIPTLVLSLACCACVTLSPLEQNDAVDGTTAATKEATASLATEFTPVKLTAPIIGVEGTEVGNLTAYSAPTGLLLQVYVQQGTLTPGWHGIHLHENPDCSDIGTFKKSGGHVGKFDGGHGLMNPIGPEGGELPNIHAADDGSALAEMFTTRTDLAELEAIGGFALVIHAKPDDHITQPIGGAGPRVACAAVEL